MEKPLLLPIVRSVGAPPDVQVMPYREIAKLVTRYILEKADTFFDPRNISVANIRGDPLSAALNVDSIHRTQIHHFTQNGIINFRLLPDYKHHCTRCNMEFISSFEYVIHHRTIHRKPKGETDDRAYRSIRKNENIHTRLRHQPNSTTKLPKPQPWCRNTT